MKLPAVYILTNQSHFTLYIGVTSDLVKRVFQHKNHQFEDMENAIEREKSFKKWLRKWKSELITQSNPNWIDLWNNNIQ